MGLLPILVYEAIENEDLTKVWKVDRMLTVQNLPRETREGTQRMGERMLNLVESLYEFPVLSQYRKRIKEKQSFGHPAIVFTMIGHHLGVPRSTTTLYYLYSTVIKSCSKCGSCDPVRTNRRSENDSGFSNALIRATEKIQDFR